MTGCCRLLSEFEVLGPFQAQLLLRLTCLAFQPEYDLTCRLGLLVEDGLCLSTESHLLRVVTSLPLCEIRRFAGLVLCDLVHGVLLALAATVCLAFLRDVHHLLFLYNSIYRSEM